MNPEGLIGRLVEAEAEVVLVGGLAAVLHGSNHVTVDVDVCYRPSPENRERVVQALVPLGPYLRGVDPGLPFVWNVRTLAGTPLLTLTTTAGPIDLLPDVLGVGSFEAVLKRSQPMTLLGLVLPVMTLDALIDAKRAADRPKDRLMLPELEALRALGG